MTSCSPAAPIAVQPLGAVSGHELRRVTRILAGDFNARTLVLDPLPLPASAFAHERAQFDADVVLEELFTRLPERCLRIVGVTEQDLFVAGRTFVFGYAHLTDGMALYSVTRLRAEFYGRAPDGALLDQRVRRALVHELGHTFGAPHCDDERCAMHTVTQVDTLDALAPAYCAACGARVQSGLGVPPWSARGRWERGMALYRRRLYARAAVELEHAVRCAPFEARYREAFDSALRAAHDEAQLTAASGSSPT
jgi:archaemetzincin